MKRYLLIVLLLAPLSLFAQAKLDNLVSERNKMHAAWKVSESKKTGIFGNRTKKDMIETNEWMERIIQKDNQIMEELKMLSEIEKTEITYEKNDYKFISQKQEREIAMLKRALEEKEGLVIEEKSESRTYEWLTFILFLSTAVLAFLNWKKLKS
ncbi:Clp protease ClpB [Aquiflexum sp. XJ19-11]|uniref:Clp protease ClpB n=1 Tax=Aquiflexum gelatinilyticum TaxID=2961943 RepID=A0A9X2PAN9_9BACT|nr:Clp protease ClpB [Aquiflexum gelatinilyticum]MCR9016860.1 Clp protease ClpB [Aquiflexum gelatinilyticum]